ncbi:MAG: hypothetical protein KDA27_03910 [Candidatus Eisenbacteria bacterium]|uniref:PEP-CTERM sorting domain-containing protein n=1 Tax=Eiseniibacteriota bacterium TaxID=2212470 RepID=A0A956SD03_UNCEI|nr:hypothetical protein [Candidatus Eisenbacteria bacterium]MCB9463285.1 hypothetical protein [Candidatus Eisenbacteria bacterium]
MVRRLLALGVVATFLAVPAFAGTAHKDGTPTLDQAPSVPQSESTMRADWVYNTGGSEDFVPTTGGSFDGWGEWFITTVYNDTGSDLTLTELGFPCAGPMTEDYGWLVWLGLGGLVAPTGDAYTADYFGQFTPVDPGPDTFPPTVYTYVDVSAANIVVPAGTYFAFGYDNTGTGGQTDFNGVETWAWYGGLWDPDINYGRTAILQVKGNYGAVPVEQTTWGQIKGLYR